METSKTGIIRKGKEGKQLRMGWKGKREMKEGEEIMTEERKEGEKTEQEGRKITGRGRCKVVRAGKEMTEKHRQRSENSRERVVTLIFYFYSSYFWSSSIYF